MIDTHCGLHGDPTTTGRCATCDATYVHRRWISDEQASSLPMGLRPVVGKHYASGVKALLSDEQVAYLDAARRADDPDEDRERLCGY